MTLWRDTDVWQAVAAELRAHRRNGLGRLLTEDTVRFAAARALVGAGADAGGLGVEWPHPELPGSRVDLVAGGSTTPAVLIEFKFPREPHEKNAAWTMALGEVLKDFYRLAVCRGPVDRLFVYVETARLRRYMAGAATRYGLDLDVDRVVLRPADAARLPTTAAQIIGAELAAHHVTARRIESVDIDDTLRLSVYVVDSLGVTPSPAAAGLVADDAEGHVDPSSEGNPGPEAAATAAVAPAERTRAAGSRNGARHEILAAVHAVLARSGQTTFTPAQIVTEMNRRGTGYAETTIRTMVTAHMCRNAPDNAGSTYDDLERIDRGVYRLFLPH